MRQYTREYIKSLLAKFMDGTTTLEEEDALSRYFQGSDVPEEWHDYQQLFQELEAMKPQVPQRPATRRWLRWSAAAAVVVGIFFTATQWQPTEQTAPASATITAPASLTAQADREDTVLRPEPPNQEVAPDSTVLRRMLEKKYPPKRSRRSLRKPEPTMNDIDKGYALLAAAERERQQVEQQIVEVRQEVAHIQLTAAGFTPIMLEDGTIIYIDEPKDYFAYEE